jgi:hypothetical protein
LLAGIISGNPPIVGEIIHERDAPTPFADKQRVAVRR